MKFYSSLEKGLKLKLTKFLGLIPTFAEVTEGKLVQKRGGVFLPPILNRVNTVAENFVSSESQNIGN